MGRDPLERHASTPEELRDRLAAERRGTPFLIYRDAEARQVIVELADAARVTIGRSSRSDIALCWDGEVSRLHAVVELVGANWVLSDDRLSRNGSFVNGNRVHSRALRSGDQIVVGDTRLAFIAPDQDSESVTRTAGLIPAPAALTPAQRRVLVALCRPVLEDQVAASNREIADELVLAIDTVKGALSRLFAAFGIDSEVPQNQKRALLARRAMQAGAVRAEDFDQ